MFSDHVEIIGKSLVFALPYLPRLPGQRVTALHHAWTWQDTPDAQNVVVIGGSFGAWSW